ncbi:MAG: outer membrane beta-barrel protein [Methylocystis sp.]
MIKRRLIGSLLLAGATMWLKPPLASAADLLPSTKAPPVVAPAPFTWTGFYVGSNFTYTWTDDRWIDVASANVFDGTRFRWGAPSALGATGVAGARFDGFLSGISAGYNWEFADRVVGGFESDIAGAGVRGGGGIDNILANPTSGILANFARAGRYVVTGSKLDRNLEYLGTIRVRLGYAFTPKLLTYATGGFAYGGVNESVTIGQNLTPSLLLSNTAKGNVFENRIGWTAGAGLEYALTPSLSAKLEYLYYDLGSIGMTNASISPLAFRGFLLGRQVTDASAAWTRYDGHSVRVGANYRFDWSVPNASPEGASPLLASPRVVAQERPSFGDWSFSATTYNWAIGINGDAIAANQTIGLDASFIDFLSKSSAFPLQFAGRVEASDGPLSIYGDVIWMQLRASGSLMQLRSPFADIGIAANADAHMRMTMTVGEAGGAYELARWKLTDTPGAFTALDGYAGIRYMYVGVDANLDAIGVVNSEALGLEQIGAKAIASSGAMKWVDPTVGLRVRHDIAPGQEFQFRGDIGGFGAGSKFAWEAYGGYSYDFNVVGRTLTGTLGYRALGVDYVQQNNNGRPSGINAILHGPVIGFSSRF